MSDAVVILSVFCRHVSTYTCFALLLPRTAIGDCYVATTGLPHVQADHAVIMARFADEAMKQMRDLVHGELADALGETTADLAMRFGMHSGPVTGGVLRGEKSRFQIFGDTVNTAAVGIAEHANNFVRLDLVSDLFF